jgi:secondary thiamine-phosphate synthase enzyme
MYTIDVKTTKNTEMIDITGEIREFIREADIKTGSCIVFVPHTTAGITINENADPSVRTDILSYINKAVPVKNNYLHMEGNSAAHIKAGLFGSSLQLIIENGDLILGTWQGIYLCEFDGPRYRRVYVKVFN